MEESNKHRFSAYRIMWIFVLFDLPTETKKERKAASLFRQNLLKDGFLMFQYSIYVRHCLSKENATTHIRRVKKFLPKTGKTSLFQLTDKQFSEIELFYGTTKVPQHSNPQQLELF